MEFLQINASEDIDDILNKSQAKPQIIFKHSTACPVSRMSYEKMKLEYPLNNSQADLYYIGVIEQREISNYIASSLGVVHESPQLIVIKNGRAIFNESHLMIQPKDLTNYIS